MLFFLELLQQNRMAVLIVAIAHAVVVIRLAMPGLHGINLF
jgi:hypothetical protein